MNDDLIVIRAEDFKKYLTLEEQTSVYQCVNKIANKRFIDEKKERG